MYLQKVMITKTKYNFCWRLEGPHPNPDPLVRGMDSRIRIHTKISWIRNPGFLIFFYSLPTFAKKKILQETRRRAKFRSYFHWMMYVLSLQKHNFFTEIFFCAGKSATQSCAATAAACVLSASPYSWKNWTRNLPHQHQWFLLSYRRSLKTIAEKLESLLRDSSIVHKSRL